jgi:hypothetical protein
MASEIETFLGIHETFFVFDRQEEINGESY